MTNTTTRIFEKGDLIKLKEDPSNIIYEVSMKENDVNTIYMTDSAGDETNISTYDIELVKAVKDRTYEDTLKPMEPNTPKLEPHEVHAELNKLIVSTIDGLRKDGFEDAILIEVSANNYSGDETEVKYKVRLGGYSGTEVESANMTTSAYTVLRRHRENESLKPKSIPHYR